MTFRMAWEDALSPTTTNKACSVWGELSGLANLTTSLSGSVGLKVLPVYTTVQSAICRLLVIKHEQVENNIPAAEITETSRPRSRGRTELMKSAEGRRKITKAREELGNILRHEDLAPLAALRLRAGLSQSELAQRCGMHQPHISRIENGEVDSPNSETVNRLAKALGVDMSEVFEAIKQQATQRAKRHV